MEIGTRVRASREWIDKHPLHEPASDWTGTFQGVCDNGMVKVLWDFDKSPANHRPEFIEAIPEPEPQPQPEPPKPPKKKWHERLKRVLADAGTALGEALFGRNR